MPSTSSNLKKGESKSLTITTKEGDMTPVRISSRVRKEKFSVKELFNQKESQSEDSSSKKVGKKKIPTSPTGKTPQLKTDSTTKSVKNDPPKESATPKISGIKPQSKDTVSKLSGTKSKETVKPQVSKSSGKVAVVKKENSSVAQSDVNKERGKISPSKTKVSSNKTEPIFNENNIEKVLEDPSALGLEVVVTRLSESSENKDAEVNKVKNKNVVTISKVSGDSASPSKPMKVIPMKAEKKSESPEKSKVPSDQNNQKTRVAPSSPTNSDESKITSESANSSLENVKNSSMKKPKFKENVKTDTVDSKKKESRVTKKSGSTDSEIPSTRRTRKRAIISERSDSQSSDVNRVDDSSKMKKPKFAESDDEGMNGELKKGGTPDDFGRYFTTTQSMVEHNESLDSEDDGSESVNILSTFSDKEVGTVAPDSTVEPEPESTIYELMAEVSISRPAWSLHVMQDNGAFLLACVTRVNGLPVMNKFIELDGEEFTAKVYINRVLHRQFSGVYNTYQSILELIEAVDETE